MHFGDLRIDVRLLGLPVPPASNCLATHSTNQRWKLMDPERGA